MATALSGIGKETSKGSGGIYEVYCTELANVSGATAAAGIASFASDAGVWSRYVLGKEAGSNFVSNGASDIAAGTIQYEQVLTMIFKKNQVAKRNELKVLGQSELVFVVNDNDAPQTATGSCTIGDLYICGLETCTNPGGAEMITSVISTGSQLSEANNMTINLSVKETFPPLAITEADYLLIRAGSAVTV